MIKQIINFVQILRGVTETESCYARHGTSGTRFNWSLCNSSVVQIG